MVRATQLAGILVFHVGWLCQSVSRTAEAALHTRNLFLRNSHLSSLSRHIRTRHSSAALTCETHNLSEWRGLYRQIGDFASPNTKIFCTSFAAAKCNQASRQPPELGYGLYRLASDVQSLVLLGFSQSDSEAL